MSGHYDRIKTDTRVICHGEIKCKSARFGYEYRAAQIIDGMIIAKKVEEEEFWREPEKDLEFFEKLKTDVVTEIRLFADIRIPAQLLADIVETASVTELLAVRRKASTYEEIKKGVVFKVCSAYLRPNIHIVNRRLSMVGAYLSELPHRYTDIDNVLTVYKIRSTSCVDSDQKYFDYIDIEVGYITSISKEQIKAYISEHKSDISMLLYDKLFITIMRKYSLWDKVSDVLSIIRYMKLERIRITSQNLIIFRFGFKDEN